MFQTLPVAFSLAAHIIIILRSFRFASFSVLSCRVFSIRFVSSLRRSYLGLFKNSSENRAGVRAEVAKETLRELNVAILVSS